MADLPGHAADSPANTNEQRGTAWPGFAMDDRMVQLGQPSAPQITPATVAPAMPAVTPITTREHPEFTARRPGPIIVNQLGGVEHPGQPDPFPRPMPQRQPSEHTAPIRPEGGR